MNRSLDEAGRQAALLAMIAAPFAAVASVAVEEHRLSGPQVREQGDRFSRGLAAYRAHAAGTAARALGSVFPTVRQVLGAAEFERLAAEFWRAQPPVRGDLGEHGADFPAFIEHHARLAAWPWLADTSRLDLAVHRNERAADATLDTVSLRLLQTTDPALVRLRLMPGSALLRSPWPIATIFAAHPPAALESGAAETFAAMARAIAGQRGETVLVVRQGWRAVVRAVDEGEAGWIRSLLDGLPLATALGNAGAAFDFSAWLIGAVRERSVSGVVLLGSDDIAPCKS